MSAGRPMRRPEAGGGGSAPPWPGHSSPRLAHERRPFFPIFLPEGPVLPGFGASESAAARPPRPGPCTLPEPFRGGRPAASWSSDSSSSSSSSAGRPRPEDFAPLPPLPFLRPPFSSSLPSLSSSAAASFAVATQVLVGLPRPLPAGCSLGRSPPLASPLPAPFACPLGSAWPLGSAAWPLGSPWPLPDDDFPLPLPLVSLLAPLSPAPP
mmetsp:Transcript_62020/g.171513  ORF Transcript_62020/g.171513 Transcript_62020/m.171513 type:complete len:210 (+) Transcript_62020:158-787(+)